MSLVIFYRLKKRSSAKPVGKRKENFEELANRKKRPIKMLGLYKNVDIYNQLSVREGDAYYENVAKMIKLRNIVISFTKK